jgi:hypothetical protein
LNFDNTCAGTGQTIAKAQFAILFGERFRKTYGLSGNNRSSHTFPTVTTRGDEP